jgi:hypothetical protein
VVSVGARLQSGALVGEGIDDLLQIADIACQPINPGDDQCVARTDGRVSSGNAFEFCLLGNTFVRFVRALDAIESLVALGWKQLRDLIHAGESR